MAEKTYSKDDVLKAWNEKAGRKDYFELREVESTEGVKATQIISGGGSLTAQVDAQGAEAYKQLAEQVGNPFIDPGVNPKESVSDENKKFYTKEGNIAFPTQPEALSGAAEVNEIDNSGDTDRASKANNKTANTTSGQKTTDLNSRNVSPTSSSNTTGTRTAQPEGTGKPSGTPNA